MNWMIKTLAVIIGVGLGWGIYNITYAQGAELDGQMIKAQEQMFDPAVQIRVGTNLMNIPFEGLCSGQIIKSVRDFKTGKVANVILTAKHCTSDTAQRMQVVKYVHNKANREVKQDVYKAKVCARSYVSDLALLKLDDEETAFEHTASVADKDINLNFGDLVDLVGYPAGLGLTWTQGRLGYVEDTKGVAFDDVSNSGEFYRATPMMTGGSSGSSMFVEQDGQYKVIGVLTGGGLQYIGFYTPINEIDAFLTLSLPDCGVSNGS